MLTKKSRISKKFFEKALLNSKVFHSDSFSVRYNQKSLENKAFFSVVVSKKVSKLAVIRNKLKRRVYSLITKEAKNLKNKGYFVFFMKPGSEKATFRDLSSEILAIFKKIG